MLRQTCTILAAFALLALPLGLVAQPPPPRQALLLGVEGTPQAFPSIDKGGNVILVPQTPSRMDIVTQNADGTVEAQVVALDLTTDRVTVRTTGGQVLVLGMAYGDLTTMQMGETYTFVVRPRSPAR